MPEHPDRGAGDPMRLFRRKRGYRFPNGIPRVQMPDNPPAATVTVSIGNHSESLPYNASAAEFIDSIERVWAANQEEKNR